MYCKNSISCKTNYYSANTNMFTYRIGWDKESYGLRLYWHCILSLKMKGEVIPASGKAGEGAIKVAHERNATMIVCGARGHGTLRRTILGSNSEYIMHHADIPVVICKHKAHQNPTSEHKN